MSHLSFSQREGIETLPTILKLDEMPDTVRNEFIYAIDNIIPSSKHFKIFSDLYVKFFDRPSECFSLISCHMMVSEFIHYEPYNKVFDLLEFILNDKENQKRFLLKENIQDICKRRKLAYVLFMTEQDNLIQFIPFVSKEAGDAYLKSLDPAFNKVQGSRKHLLEAGKKLKEGDFSGTIRESIHAVEVVVRELNEDKGKLDFNQWLRKIADKKKLHPAFVKALEFLYGYTSDEEGIRHSHLKENDADQKLAAFFFTICIAFVTYLQD